MLTKSEYAIQCSNTNFNAQFTIKEPQKHSPHIDKVQAKRSGVRITIRAKDVVLPKTSGPVLGPGHPPMQWVPGFFAGGKVAWGEGDTYLNLRQ